MGNMTRKGKRQEQFQVFSATAKMHFLKTSTRYIHQESNVVVATFLLATRYMAYVHIFVKHEEYL